MSRLPFFNLRMGLPVKIVSIILMSILLLFFLPSLKNGLRSLFSGDVSVSLAREAPWKGEWTSHNAILGFDGADQNNTDNSIISDENTFEQRIAIGVILPLSGDYAAFGKSVLNGIFLASGVFGPWSAELLPVDIIVKDSKGDPSVTIKCRRGTF